MFARIGRTYSPVSGKEVKKHSVDDIVDFLASLPEGTKVIITSSAEIPENINISEYFSFLNKQGFNRIEAEGELIKIDELKSLDGFKPGQQINIVIDRLVISHSADSFSRAADSAQTAFQTGKGYCQVVIIDENGDKEGKFFE